MRRSAALAATGELTFERGNVLRLLAVEQLQAGRWQLAVQIHQVLWAAIDATPSPEVSRKLSQDSILWWLEIVNRALWEAPDARLYHDAIRRGRAEIDAALARNDGSAAAEIAFLLAAVHLDPYVMHRGIDQYRATEQEWARRLRAGTTWDGERMPESPDGECPSVEEAMRLAEQWIRRAIDLGGDPTRTLKLLAAALHGRQALEGKDPTVAAEMAAVVAKAVEQFTALDDPVRLVEVLGLGQEAGVPLDRARLLQAVSIPIEPLYSRYEGGDVLIMLRNAAYALQMAGAGPDAYALVARTIALVEERIQDNQRADWYPTVTRALRNRFGNEGYRPETPTADVIAAWKAFLDAQHEGKWPREMALSVAIDLCERSVASGQEPDAAQILETALRMTRDLHGGYARAARYLRALMLHQAAGRRAAKQRIDEAVPLLLQALYDSLSSHEPDVRIEVLTDLSRTIADASIESVDLAARAFADALPFVEAQLGQDSEVVYDILGRGCVASLKNSRGMFALPLMRLAKGYRFGAAVRSGVGRRYAKDERTAAAQRLAADALAEAPGADLEDLDRMKSLRDVLLVSPVVPSRVVAEGASAAERLINLRHRADALLEASLGSAALEALGAAAGTPSTCDVALDEKTVLLEFLLTRVDGTEVVIRCAQWSGGAHASGTVMGSGSAPPPQIMDKVVVHLGEVGASIVGLRQAIQEDAAAEGDVSLNARAALDRLAELLLGDFTSLLPELRHSGKTHLCIVPHGPLHVAPLHLLPVVNRPLAENWIVTFAPTPWLLARRMPESDQPPSRTVPLVAIGVSFPNGEPFGLSPLDNVPSEIATVAATLDGEAYLDAAATETAIEGALGRARFLHIATHGMHDATAPSYHTLFCAPGDGGDGRLLAHELLGKDLRGLELVTMSACETALGRFDFGDNLRGIPAALFLGGVRALIGCLWDIETNAAETFFSALYGAIRDGQRPVDAFAHAQKHTRSRHSEYRDWGAFYFSGDWRTAV